mmetsp:Transcript_11704/g.50120  ORF Transcript_11704/g.50120 Transcript_11704/m.50120 type:complete len:356 (-) Transcript_11704:9682-10749(-)
MAHTLGAAGSATVDETLACTPSPPAAYEAPRTTFVPHARATETTTAYCSASASGVAHREVTIATCAAGSPHPIAFSTSDPATRRHLGANALYRDSAGSALARSMTVARDFTAARGASKNTAPQGDSGSGAAARTFATRCSGTPGSASAASRSAAAAVASAAEERRALTAAKDAAAKEVEWLKAARERLLREVATLRSSNVAVERDLRLSHERVAMLEEDARENYGVASELEKKLHEAKRRAEDLEEKKARLERDRKLHEERVAAAIAAAAGRSFQSVLQRQRHARDGALRRFSASGHGFDVPGVDQTRGAASFASLGDARRQRVGVDVDVQRRQRRGMLRQSPHALARDVDVLER